VQRAHRWDKPENAIFGARLSRHLLHPGYRVDYFHF
jgi:hypothetical protein